MSQIIHLNLGSQDRVIRHNFSVTRPNFSVVRQSKFNWDIFSTFLVAVSLKNSLLCHKIGSELGALGSNAHKTEHNSSDFTQPNIKHG